MKRRLGSERRTPMLTVRSIVQSRCATTPHFSTGGPDLPPDTNTQWFSRELCFGFGCMARPAHRAQGRGCSSASRRSLVLHAPSSQLAGESSINIAVEPPTAGGRRTTGCHAKSLKAGRRLRDCSSASVGLGAGSSVYLF